MKKISSVILASTLLTSLNSYAECTLQIAQTKMVETTNMMQVYSRQRIDYIEKGDIPGDFEAQFTAFSDRSNALVADFAKETEANPDAGFESPISQSICDGYDELFSDYAPDGYEKKEVNLLPMSAGADCTSEGLWEKYGVLIQQQTELAKLSKFSDAELAEMQRIGTKIGEASTTDLAQACVHLEEFSEIISSK